MNNRSKKSVLVDMESIKQNAAEYDKLYRKLAEDKEKYSAELNRLYRKSLEVKFEVQVLRMEYAVLAEQYSGIITSLNDYEKLNN